MWVRESKGLSRTLLTAGKKLCNELKVVILEVRRRAPMLLRLQGIVAMERYILEGNEQNWDEICLNISSCNAGFAFRGCPKLQAKPSTDIIF